MPDVPNVPGVPSLSSYSSNLTPLIIGDALIAVAAFLRPAWGIYLNGSPVITPASFITQQFAQTLGAISSIASLIGFPNIVPTIASTIEFDYSGDSPISTYPQEEGAFQSYDKVQLPFDVRLKLACGGTTSQRQAFLDTLEALRTSTVLLDIVTPEKVYSDVNCKHFDFSRRASNGVQLIVADVGFQQVRIEQASTFSNTMNPTSSATQSIGNVQPQAAPATVTQQFNGLGGAPY